MGSRCEYKDLDGSYLRKYSFFLRKSIRNRFVFFIYLIEIRFFVCFYKAATRRLAMLQTASIASGALLAIFLVIVLCIVFYVKWSQQQKRDRCNGVHEENGFDTVDGLQAVRTALPELRPFGPHHQRFIPMSQAYTNNNR